MYLFFLEKRKRIPKKEKPNRRGRIIIRNLSFKTTEDKLKKHFEEFGNIIDLQLLKRADGKLVGCAFIQYDVVQNATRAIHHRSGKDFLGRPIICDWAVAKNTYVKKINQTVEVKDEPIEVKDEPPDEVCEVKEESEKSDSDSESDSDNSEASDEDGDNEDSSEDASEEESTCEEPKQEDKKPRVISNDVNEGKTVFIKNMPFTARNEDLAECMAQFGPIFYALVCMDHVTEHSKGTAFVKFRVSKNFVYN